MKNKLVIAAAVTAGTALITYLVRRRRANGSTALASGQKSHHRTNIFANAKDHR